MTEFNPNCGKCGMLNSRGFCSLTACRYPSNVIVAKPKVIRGMMVNPQIEKPQTNADRIRGKCETDEGLYAFILGVHSLTTDRYGDPDYRLVVDGEEFRDDESLLSWLKAPVVEVDK